MFYFTLYHQHKRKHFVFKRPSLLPLPLFSKGSQYYKDYYLAWVCLYLGIKYLLLGGQTFKLQNLATVSLRSQCIKALVTNFTGKSHLGIFVLYLNDCFSFLLISLCIIYPQH